jgi:gluconolactonase
VRHETRAVRDAVSDLRTTAAGLDHPEGVAWFDGFVYCGTEGGLLLRIDPDSHAVHTVAETGGFLLGLAFDAAGRCYACDSGQGRVLRIDPDGRVETVCERVEGRRLVSPNYPVFLSDGSLVVSESGSYAADDGYLFRIAAGGEPEVLDRTCRRFPNGLALSADERLLYVVESRLSGVVVYRLVDGRLVERRILLDLPGIVPDGLALDREGTLYVACWRPDRVYRLRPGGELEVYLDDPTAEYLNSPTNLCFGGEELRTIYLAGLCGWTITELDAEVPGQALVHPVPLAATDQPQS